MNLRNLTTEELQKAHDAADYLLSLPVRLHPELTIKLDTFRADVTAELEDRGEPDAATRRSAVAAAK